MNRRASEHLGEPHSMEPAAGVPAPRPGMIVRTALLERLCASDAQVVQVAAPAGYGKTTLLAQWAAVQPRPVTWLSLDERDDDPVVLLRRLAATLQPGRTDQPDPAEVVVAPSTVVSAAVPRIGLALAQAARPVAIVVDDVHVLGNQTSLDALASLARHLPDGSQMVFSGRTVAGLPTARWRVAGTLLELGPAEMALSPAEARAVLATDGAGREDDDLAEIYAYTEGWPAGVYLARLARRSRRPRSGGAPLRLPHLEDYVRLEHVAALPRDEVAFLMGSAVLEPFTAPLCDAVLGRTGSAGLLARLEQTNLFVVPLPGDPPAYRYHPVYRDVLREELELSEPGATERIRRDAARWYADCGDIEAAIAYSLVADDPHQVATLVEQIGTEVYRSGRVATVEAWLAAIEVGEVLIAHPRAAVIGGLVHALEGRAVEAQQWLGMVERTTVDAAPEPGSTMAGWAAVLRGLLFAGGVEQLVADSELALAEVSPFGPWRASALWLRGVAMLAAGSGDPRPLFDDAAEMGSRNGSVHAEITALASRALLALADEDDRRAAVLVDRARTVVAGHGMEEAPTAALVAAACARLDLRRGDPASARCNVTWAQRLRPHVTFVLPWNAVRLRLELATALLQLSDAAGATILLREIDDVVGRRPDLGTLRGEAEELRRRIRAAASQSLDGWPATLTEAELRLLPLLTTHLTFREIAARLFVSQNTVKTHAISVYRKLGASSRGEAIARAAAIGLVDPAAAAVSERLPLAASRATARQATD